MSAQLFERGPDIMAIGAHAYDGQNLGEGSTDSNGDSFARVWAVFADREDELGRPDAPTREGFVVLAGAGSDIWNSWRVRWPEPSPNFREVDFTDAPVDFEGFRFSAHGANESIAIDEPRVDFSGAKFGTKANFSHTQFGCCALFNGAQFGTHARFDGAQFGDLASFGGARFGDLANFSGAQFGAYARFDGAQFGDLASFGGAQFGACARFDGAQLGGLANFGGAQFGRSARFDGAQFSDLASFKGAQFRKDASFAALDWNQTERLWRELNLDEAHCNRLTKCAERLGLRSDAFQDITFSGARFAGRVSFQNRQFLGRTDFGPREDIGPPMRRHRKIRAVQQTLFEGVPYFHGCKLHPDTSFDGAQFLAPTSAEAARAYRTLKLAMAQQQATREEQRFFRLEMMAEGALAKGTRRGLFKLYGILSDYGFSLMRPFIFWLGCIAIFGIAHGALTGPSALHSGMDWQRTMQWAQYVLLNAIPLPGFDKLQMQLRTQLFCHDEGVVLFVIALDMLHKTCALIAAFLAGLVLRNLFKMKG